MPITAPQILDLFALAGKLWYDVTVKQDFNDQSEQIGWIIKISGQDGPRSTTLTMDCEESRDSDYYFDVLETLLKDDLIVQEEADKRARAKKELLNSLTKEQRELLGFK